QERAKTLRDPASSTGMSALSQNTFLADRLEAFATRHSPSTPIVPQAGVEEAAQEFQTPLLATGGEGGRMPPGTPIGFGEAPPPGEPPPPPTGEGPPEPLRPLPGTLAEVGETARQRGPTLFSGEPGYQKHTGTLPVPPPPRPVTSPPNRPHPFPEPPPKSGKRPRSRGPPCFLGNRATRCPQEPLPPPHPLLRPSSGWSRGLKRPWGLSRGSLRSIPPD